MGSPPTSIGPYQVIRKLGEGGMGAVFEAMNPAIERRVALKVLHAQYASDPSYAERFFNEARAVNRVDHPGLVQISDHGRTEDGTAYLVMELLKGETLDKRIQKQGAAMSPGEVARLGFQIADSLAAAHQKGIIHRDLKPENVMIVADPHVAFGERTKLLDFGIAKLLEGAGGRVNTKTGTSIGTPYYMSPEQWDEAKGVNAKADVYSLGIMLYEMLTGQLPFQGPSLAQLMGQHMFKEALSLREALPALPPGFAELVHSMLRKERDQRPDMDTVAGQLHELSADLPQVPRPRRASSAELTPASTGLASTGLASTGLASTGLAGSTPVPMIDSQGGRPTGAVAGQTLTRRIGKRGAAMASAVLVLGVVSVGALRLINGRKAGSQASSATGQSTEGRSVATPAPEAPVVQRKVRWSIETMPPGSEVIDTATGTSLGTTPLRIEQVAGSGQKQLRLSLAGYAERVISVERDANVSRQEILDRLALRSAKKGAGKGTPGKPKVATDTAPAAPNPASVRSAKGTGEVPVIE